MLYFIVKSNVYFVYAIKSMVKEYIYVGMTNDLTRRLNQHNSGWNRSTKPYIPLNLIYQEQCASRAVARTREKYWKSASGKRKLKGMG